jgi:tetratricopeptide (TPR) repeat protein
MSRTPLLFVLALLLTACASQPEPRTELSWSATRMRADAYYNQGQMVDAVPLYEELLKKEPKNPLFAGRLAYCLLAKFETLPTGGERTATIVRAKKMAQRARELGDNGNLTLSVLDRASDPEALVNRRDTKMHAAEALFVRGDMDGALAAYQEIAAADPKSYDAPLFAGDVYYRKRDYAQAGEWFQKAILIDPNRETTCRYWGDALATAGDNEAALSKFTDAVVAEPYNKSAWVGLSQWAQKNSATLDRTQVAIPTSVSGKDGKTINIDEHALDDPQAGAAWLVYASSRATWGTELFKKSFPQEKQYRRTLDEEVTALRFALTVLDGKEVKDPGLRRLEQLEKNGMLEAYVLLSAPDNGIAQDYARYRNEHRQVLRDYLKKYVVKRGPETH